MWKCGGGRLFSFHKRWQPRHLDYLDKSHCNLQVVPDDVLRHERTLEDLSLEANQLTDLPQRLYRMQKLRRLILADNEIQDLSNELGNLTSLEELDISKNDFRAIPDAIEKCKKLRYLDVSNNTLGALPDSITKLPELCNWVVNDIALGEIPPEIGSLSNLVILELRDNCIKFLPLSFSFLSNLERLDLGGNEIEELPDTIGQLPSLVELWLDNNFLSTLPPEIGELKTLQCLDVSENRIDELPNEIGGLEALTDFIISSNVLHELPEGIGSLSQLQILKVDQNEIDEITDSIGGLTSLLELILTDNVVEFLPAAVGKLIKLSHLNVDRNRLFTFPPELGQCDRLSVLSARDNQIAKLPKEIGNCRSLTVLALSGNKLENLPLTVSSLPLKALWLSQNQSQSILKLQVEDDEVNAEKVLTCFLFPQEALQSTSIDNFMNAVYDNPDKEWQPSAVHFLGSDKEAENKESNLQRHDTPYPRDLRSRHPHLIRKRSNSADSDKSGEHSHSHVPLDEKGIKKKVVDHADPELLINGTDNPASSSGATNNPAVSFGGIDNPAVLFGGIDNNQSVSFGNVGDATVSFIEPVPVSEDESEHSSNSQNSSDECEHTEKHVGFVVTDDEVPTENRLHRKDTPHFLKGKRILQSDDNKTLQDILMNMERRKSQEEFECNNPADTDDAGNIFANTQAVGEANVIDESDFVVIDKPEEATVAGSKYKRRDTPRPAEFEKLKFKPQIDPSHIFAEEEEEEDSNEIEEQETVTRVYEELTAVIERDGPSLGINVAGSMGNTTFQEDEELASDLNHFDEQLAPELEQFDDQGVFITKITLGGPADKVGVLKIGDKIIRVNETDISEASHADAVQTLTVAGSKVNLVVLREVTDEEQINLALSNQKEEKNVRFAAEPEVEDIEIKTEMIPVMLKRDGKGLGFSIAGGKGASATYREKDEGVFISKLSENGPASLDKRLQVGDKLLSINGVDVRKSKHEDIVKILTSCGDKVSLIAYREHIINKKMKPISQINGNVEHVKTVGESTMVEGIPSDIREPRLLVEEVVLKKSAGPLGLSIVGGSDHASHPFGVNEPGIFVSKIIPTGEAAKTNLCVGDRLLRVNGVNMQHATHHEAVAALISNEPEVSLFVRHDPPPPGIQEINILKKLGEKLGISIRGGSKGHPGNPFDKDDEGIFVSKVNPSGAAARGGQLKVGMRILEVNSTSLLGVTHVDAVRALRTAGDHLSMIVCDGYDEKSAAELNQENILFNPALCEPTRFSPDSQSSATSGESYVDDLNGPINHHSKDIKVTEELYVESDNEIDEDGNKVKRTPSAVEQRLINAEERAKWRQERMAALEHDAKKAQVVIAQVKALSTSSLEGLSDIEDKVNDTTSSR